MQSFENFLVLCEELNYTKAAKRLGISQPSLSAYIKRLENFFGTKLFSKNGSSLVLTTQGGAGSKFCYADHATICRY